MRILLLTLSWALMMGSFQAQADHESAKSALKQAKSALLEIDQRRLAPDDQKKLTEAFTHIESVLSQEDRKIFWDSSIAQRLGTYPEYISNLCNKAELQAWENTISQCYRAGYQDCGGPNSSTVEEINNRGGLLYRLHLSSGVISGADPFTYCSVQVGVEGFLLALSSESTR